MKILFISTENPFPVDHGHHIRTYHILKGLAENHKIYFVGFTQDQAGFDNKSRLEELCESVDIFLLSYRGWRQLILSLINFFSPLPLIAQKYHHRGAINCIKKLIDYVGIDLVHIDMLHIANYRKEIGALPCVLVNHNIESLRLLRWSTVEKNLIVRNFLTYQQNKLRQFEKTACNQFDRCVAVSDFDKKLLLELCGEGNFVTIPNGVDSNYFNIDGEVIVPNSLVWIGSMKNPYNKDAVKFFLEKIWPIISKKLPEANVKFVGYSPPKELIRISRRSPSVMDIGYVNDVRPHVANSVAFIAPLRCGSGTKIKVLNAMAQGKPVVTTSIGAEGIEAKHDEEIIIADDPADFAQKTIYLLKHPEVAKNIGLRARKVIEKKYDWRIINEKVNHLYRDIASKHQYRK